MTTEFYEVKTVPDTEPLLLAEAKSWCKVETTADDDLITALIVAARLAGEKYTGRIFVNTTFTGKYSAIEVSNCEQYPYIGLRRAPLSSITSVKMMIDDSLEVVDTDLYMLKEKLTYSRILFTGTLPSGDKVAYPLEVEFVAGYGAAAAVPEDIITALKQHILYFYENRGDVTPEGKAPMPIEVKALYSKYRIVDTF